MEPILEFEVEAPFIGSGKHKNQLPTINNAPLWVRYQKTKIKNEFKDILTQWFMPKSELNIKSFTVEFGIKRPSKKKLDSDALFYVYKWIIDTFVEQGYADDDDKVTIKVNPAILNGSKVGTVIKVRFFNDD